VLSQQERLTFLAGGVAAPRDGAAPTWTQLGLARPKSGVYAELSATVQDMLAGDRITDFFFMHKPPGLRVRFAETEDAIAHTSAAALAFRERAAELGLGPALRERDAPFQPDPPGISRRAMD